MTIFGGQNCVFTVNRQASGSGYRLAGLRSAPPLVIQGASFSDTDIILPVNTLDKKRFLYSFGKHFDGGQLQGVAMLSIGSVGLARYVDGIRTSAGHGPVTFSTPLGGYRVWVTGFGMAPADAEYSLQPFSIMFKIAS